MKKISSIFTAFTLITAATTFLSGCASNAIDADAPKEETTQGLTLKAVKALKELYVVKELQLALLKTIHDNASAQGAYLQMEELRIRESALEAALHEERGPQILSMQNTQGLNNKLDINSQSVSEQVAVLNAKITNEEFRLNNLESYWELKQKIQSKTATAEEIPLYTPSVLSNRRTMDIQHNQQLVLNEIILALDAWPAQKPALKQAERQISDLIAASPDFEPVWVQLARWHIKRAESDGLRYRFKRLERAEQAVSYALTQNPRNADAWALWGELATINQHWYKAKDRLAKAEKLGSKDPWLLINHARVASHFNNEKDAYRYYLKASRTQGKRTFPKAIAHGELAKIYLRSDRLNKAKEAFDSQIEFIPRAGKAKAAYASELLFAAGDYERVIELAEKLGSDVTPTTHAMAHYLRWAIKAKRGDAAAAMDSLIKAQRILPNLNTAMAMVGKFRNRDELLVLINTLKTQGVDINAQDNRGKSAVHVAIEEINVVGTEVLVELDASLNVLDNQYTPAIFSAVQSKNAQMVELLLELGAEPDHAHELSKLTPLANAALLEDSKVIDVLLDAGADINAVNNNGASVLTLAISTGNLKIVRQVADAGGELKGKIDGQWTPIQFAKLINDSDLVDLIENQL